MAGSSTGARAAGPLVRSDEARSAAAGTGATTLSSLLVSSRERQRLRPTLGVACKAAGRRGERRSGPLVPTASALRPAEAGGGARRRGWGAGRGGWLPLVCMERGPSRKRASRWRGLVQSKEDEGRGAAGAGRGGVSRRDSARDAREPAAAATAYRSNDAPPGPPCRARVVRRPAGTSAARVKVGGASRAGPYGAASVSESSPARRARIT